MDKHSNPRSRQFAFPPPPAKRARTVSEMTPLPAEMYLEILKNLNSCDLKSARLISRKFNSLISNNGRNMDRAKYGVKIVGTDEGIVIEHNLKGGLKTESESLDTFNFDRWTFVEVDSLELNSLKATEATRVVFEALCDALAYFRQFHVRSLSIQSVLLDRSFVPLLHELFSKVVPTCQELLFRDCILPTMITTAQIENSKIEHFRWIDSPLNTSNDQVVRKFTQEMKFAKERKNFLAEVNSVSVETACDFVETWLNSSVAAFFNLTLQGCDEAWQIKFSMECERRKLTQYCGEFQSRAHANAHIKINFLADAQICRIWPIFDTPARSAGRVHCGARYFRDF